MWEAIKDVLNGANVWFILGFILLVIVILSVLSKAGLIKVNLKYLQIGNELTQRELIRRQVETAYVFIMSLQGKIPNKERDDEIKFYKEKNILERVYDKVIEWIIFNHITTNQLYVEDKQESICNLVYSMDVDDKYKTSEFKARMCAWTKELIEKLVHVKELYK